MRHEAIVSEETHRKAEISLCYNETKGGVDRTDKMLRVYSCKRKIDRWPMNFFFNMIDVTSVASYILWTTKSPQWNDTKKYGSRSFLQQLGNGLIDAHLNQRYQNPHTLQRKV